MKEFENKRDEELEQDAVLDFLVHLIRKNRPEVSRAEPVRCAQMQRAKTLLDAVNRRSGNEGAWQIGWEPDFLSAVVSWEGDMMEVLDPGAFAEAVLLSDNFEVYPLADGRIRMSFRFCRAARRLW